LSGSFLLPKECRPAAENSRSADTKEAGIAKRLNSILVKYEKRAALSFK
jgi:hypothetical protein